MAAVRANREGEIAFRDCRAGAVLGTLRLLQRRRGNCGLFHGCCVGRSGDSALTPRKSSRGGKTQNNQ